MNGNIALSELASGISDIYGQSSPDDVAELGADVEQNFAQMAKMCAELQSELIVITSYVSTIATHQAMANVICCEL